MVLVVGQNSTWQRTYRMTELRRGTVNRVQDVLSSAAGKGANACRVLRFYGIEHELLAYAGGPTGNKFHAACVADGLLCRFTSIHNETRVCVTLIEPDRCITEIVEPAPPITPAERTAFRQTFHDSLARASLLAIQGTAMIGENDECFREFTQTAKSHGVPVMLDSYRTHGRLALQASPEILKINQDELGELTGLPVQTIGERKLAYQHIIDQYGVQWIVITRGPQGAEGCNGSMTVHACPAKIQPVNTIGSGDSVTAGIIATLVRAAGRFSELHGDGHVFRSALAEGVVAGSANCLSLKPGHIDPEHMNTVRATVHLKDV